MWNGEIYQVTNTFFEGKLIESKISAPCLFCLSAVNISESFSISRFSLPPSPRPSFLPCPDCPTVRPIDLPHNKYCPSKAVPFFSPSRSVGLVFGQWLSLLGQIWINCSQTYVKFEVVLVSIYYNLWAWRTAQILLIFILGRYTCIQRNLVRRTHQN